MKHKTIAEIAASHLEITGNQYVMWGDTSLLDEIADECSHTNLMELHPLDRHQRILNALERSPLFKKEFINISGRGKGNPYGRCFYLINGADDNQNINGNDSTVEE